MGFERIGLFGGGFDPVHCGHLALALEAARSLHLDKIVFIPTGHSPSIDKSGFVASAHHRLAMIKIAIAPYPNFTVSDFEVSTGGASYAADTIRHFVDIRPEALHFFLLGSDKLHKLERWKGIDHARSIAIFVAFPRPDAVCNVPAWVMSSPLNGIAVSASLVRSRVANRLSISDLVPAAVQDYILKHRLYG